MFIAVDFDNTIVQQDRPYEDVTTPLVFVPGALEGLRALKAAGHILLLWSGRASRALLEDPSLDPLVRAGVRRVDLQGWMARQPINLARYEQMLAFVAEHLPDVFDAVDDGLGGKPSVEVFIDDRAFRLGDGVKAVGWPWLVRLLGHTEGPAIVGA